MIRKCLFLFAFIFILTSGCKKDNNPDNTTYQLDSVKIENLDENDSILDSHSYPISSSFIDTIIGNKNDPQELNFYPGFYTKGDSLNYVNHPEFFDLVKSVIINKSPVSLLLFNPVGSFAQDGYSKKEISYNYVSNRIENIFSKYRSHNPYSNDWFIEERQDFIYTNNNLSSIHTKRLDYSYDVYPNTYYDSITYQDTVSADYYYTSNLPNQKNLIGIDLNNIIFNSNLPNTTKGFTPYDFLLILNSRLSYNTNCSSLIEKVRFTYSPFLSGYPNMDLITTIHYTFDATKNNRVNTMKISTNFPGSTGSTLYTFYYKN